MSTNHSYRLRKLINFSNADAELKMDPLLASGMNLAHEQTLYFSSSSAFTEAISDWFSDKKNAHHDQSSGYLGTICRKFFKYHQQPKASS
jgi:hypothetical protein